MTDTHPAHTHVAQLSTLFHKQQFSGRLVLEQRQEGVVEAANNQMLPRLPSVFARTLSSKQSTACRPMTRSLQVHRL